MHDGMYSATSRVAFKGQLFSTPADWNGVLQQLEELEKAEVLRCVEEDQGPDLPVLGRVFAARVPFVEFEHTSETSDGAPTHRREIDPHVARLGPSRFQARLYGQGQTAVRSTRGH